MRKIKTTVQSFQKTGDELGVKDYEHMGVSQAERRMYTYFKTAKERQLPGGAALPGPLAGKVAAGGGNEFSE